MSNWTHDLLVIVPAELMQQANQLALALGTSEADAETFKQADFAVEIITNNAVEGVDEDGNPTSSIEKVISYGAERYAVASTKAVSQILDYFSALPAEIKEFVVFPVFNDGILIGVDMTKVQVFIDHDPFDILKMLGLARL